MVLFSIGKINNCYVDQASLELTDVPLLLPLEYWSTGWTSEYGDRLTHTAMEAVL